MTDTPDSRARTTMEEILSLVSGRNVKESCAACAGVIAVLSQTASLDCADVIVATSFSVRQAWVAIGMQRGVRPARVLRDENDENKAP